MSAYYNEIDKYAAQWLRNLIKAGLIADGVVDERSIEDVQPNDIRGFTQVHFFAGIGVWSLALRRAGWADDRRVWTGSCPCQPFSSAGKGAGFSDERHLWPAMHHLIRECRPPAVFGEQVASADAAPWLDLVQTDLEGMGYAFGAVPFPSASVGAPHIRDRNFWVAHSDLSAGRQGSADVRGWADRGDAQPRAGSGGSSVLDRLAHTDDPRLEGRSTVRQRAGECTARTSGVAGGLADHLLQQRPDGQPGVGTEYDQGGRLEGAAEASGLRGLADATGGWDVTSVAWPDKRGLSQGDGSHQGCTVSGPTNGFWADADWIFCRDGKWRPVEPGTFPLAHGVANRVGRLRAYGNAINAVAAETFIRASMI